MVTRIVPALLALWPAMAADTTVHVVKIHDAAGPVNSFEPSAALGAAIDGHERGQILKMLSPANVRQMLTAGLKPISYRLRTELAGDAWHWNPEGAWSDAMHKRGYWTSSDKPGRPILTSYGYKLPRRGNTHDQANDDGYSRIDDGDPKTFWKSNPYLDPYYTKQPMSAHPPWFAVDFGEESTVDTLKIEWGVPFAVDFHIEASTSSDIENAVWKAVPGTALTAQRGGKQTIRVPGTWARFIRVVVTATSGTAPAGQTDVRDRLGVAVGEFYAGVTDTGGRFDDLITRRRDKQQTTIYVSSTDPWHRASDLDSKVEQPGFDLIYERGLTRGLPMMVAVPLLYDTPENSAAELRYLHATGRIVKQVELGEEPEEQWIKPEDYGALYEQWANMLHAIDPHVEIGGTSIVLLDPVLVPDPSWVKRLVRYLRDHGRLADVAFFSFEWYPFDEVCMPSGPQLAEASDLLSSAMERLRADGITMPLVITEYGYSAYGSRAEVDLEGAILNADTVGLFFTKGGSAAYLYGYEPNELINDKGCTWGNNMLFGMDEHGRIEYPTATYWGARMMTDGWAGPNAAGRQFFRAETDIRNTDGESLVNAYALKRSDGSWSVLMVNKDPEQAHSIRFEFDSGRESGPADLVMYSRAQYVWKEQGTDSRPVKNDPPARSRIDANSIIDLPAYSMAVVTFGSAEARR